MEEGRVARLLEHHAREREVGADLTLLSSPLIEMTALVGGGAGGVLGTVVFVFPCAVEGFDEEPVARGGAGLLDGLEERILAREVGKLGQLPRVGLNLHGGDERLRRGGGLRGWRAAATWTGRQKRTPARPDSARAASTRRSRPRAPSARRSCSFIVFGTS